MSLQQYQSIIVKSLEDGSFIKLSLGNYQGNDKELKNLYVRKVKIKRIDMLSFNYRLKTKDIFKNFKIEEGVAKIMQYLSNDFKVATLFTAIDEIVIEHNKKGEISLRSKKNVNTLPASTAHDHEKKRLVKPDNKPYFHALGITDAEGKVYKNAQDKFKQINHYIGLLHPLLKEIPVGKLQNVVDMGSGKGYLTFALYDFLHNELNMDVAVTGIEFRPDLVKLCNEIAVSSGFDKLKFVEGTIDSYNAEKIDLLIALHACDTATDDAIFKGIQANAELIVVAPCCHKQIRREIEKNRQENEVSFLTRHGIFLERQAEMATDGLRALLLEYAGYKTKVFEFISDAHTPKNVLVVGIKQRQENVQQKAAALTKINNAKAFFGIGYHHLERLLGLNSDR